MSESEEVDPSGFGTDVVPEGVEESTENPAETQVETAEEGVSKGWKEMALSTEPNTPLEQIESPWNPEEGGLSRVYRGIMKGANVDGIPAILDVGIGFLEAYHSFSLEKNTESEEPEEGEEIDDL